jgi:hypothetical protein
MTGRIGRWGLCAGALWIGLVCCAFGGEAFDGTSARLLVERILAGEVAPQDREVAVAALAAHGDEAVTAIDAAWQDLGLPEREAAPLVEALGRIESEPAVRTLRSIAASALFIPADFPDLPGLVGALHVPDPEQAPPSPARRIWERLPADLRHLLAMRAGDLAERAGDDRAGVLTPEDAIRLANGLNGVLESMRLFDEQAFAGVNLPMKARRLQIRHHPDADEVGVGLSPLEVRLYNRLLLEAAFPGLIAPGPRLYVDHYSGRISTAALEAIAQNPHPHAREILLTFRPLGNRLRKEYLDALSKLDDDRAIWAQAEYLLFGDRGVGGVALRQIRRRRTDRTTERAVLAMYDRVERAGLDEYPVPVLRNVLRAVAALPDREEAAEVFADALAERDPAFRNAALEVVAPIGGLLKEPEVLDELADIIADRAAADAPPLEEELTEEQLLSLLQGLQRARDPQILPVVALLLESRHGPVRIRACDTMASLTDGNHGRNPVAWRKWYQEQGR